MAKEFKSNIQKPTDAAIAETLRGRPFGACSQCGMKIVTEKVLCPECERLREVGFGPFSRAPHALPGQDTQAPQSYNPYDHSGYKDTIPNGKIPPGKERV